MFIWDWAARTKEKLCSHLHFLCYKWVRTYSVCLSKSGLLHLTQCLLALFMLLQMIVPHSFHDWILFSHPPFHLSVHPSVDTSVDSTSWPLWKCSNRECRYVFNIMTSFPSRVQQWGCWIRWLSRFMFLRNPCAVFCNRCPNLHSCQDFPHGSSPVSTVLLVFAVWGFVY